MAQQPSARRIATWIVAVVVAVIVVVGFLWVRRQRATRASTEAVRQQVEEELYREGELGHRPGEVPTPQPVAPPPPTT